MDTKDILMYWIGERERIRIKKETGQAKPWSVDPIFQQTYFCNVRREDDKVTRWIRQYYNPYVGDRLFEYNMVFARFINWPPTLEKIGYIWDGSSAYRKILEIRLNELATQGKIWGNAYVVTTHGIPMSKVAYLCHNVLNGFQEQRDSLGTVFVGTPLQGCRPMLTPAYSALMRLEGLGSFMAAQVIADLKNTPGHPLQAAGDRETFVASGPGSIRGTSWFHNNNSTSGSASKFPRMFADIREFVDDHWSPTDNGPSICNQDLQNCLCEYDKYMRVREGTGRSKRNYHGS